MFSNKLHVTLVELRASCSSDSENLPALCDKLQLPAHAFAYEAHRKLAKQSDKHAAAYHKAMADHHSLMSDIHNAANPNGLKLDQ